MSIALIGASGRAGSEILKEMVARGHRVTAIARHPDAIADLPGVTRVAGDIADDAALVGLLRGHDIVVSAARFSSCSPARLVAAIKAAGGRRYLVVGGAGSLDVTPGVRLVDTPDFTEAYKPEATAGASFLDLLRDERDLDWTMLSPSMRFTSGPRTGTFRLGGDLLLTKDGDSSISFADFAIALVDEIEQPAHPFRRFTVGY